MFLVPRHLVAIGLAAAVSTAAATDLPRMAHANGRHALIVDGAPFTVMAAQLHNSSAWPATLPDTWKDVEAMHANTLEAPIYWEQFEPSPGRFDTSHVDMLVDQAREHGVRLVLLWFGTWKNGQMHYIPTWMKTDATRYPRLLDEHGQPTDSLSPYASTNLDADRRAFAALMGHLRQIDGDRHTVIMVQVENEPGAVGSVRDHGAAAEALFRQPVPGDVLRAVGKPAGSWQSVFGADADENFNAWGTARYIDQVAEAGKAAYPLPIYVNTWLRYKTKRYPGVDYPSGGATWNVLDLWKAASPHVDLIGTDLYTDDYAEFTRVVGQYARPDNPAWISETGFEAGTAKYLFHVLAQGGIGFSVFGIDHGEDTPASTAATAAHGRNFALLGGFDRQVAAAAFDGRLKADVEKPGVPRSTIDVGPWALHVSYGAPGWGDAPAQLPGTPLSTGHVLVIRLDDATYLVAGFDARVEFERVAKDGRHGQLLRVEEGTYENGTWHTRRLWNGDETDYGLNFSKAGALLKVTTGTF